MQLFLFVCSIVVHCVALGCLQSAIDADPKNPLAKFEKAAVLMSQEQYQPALTELEALKVSPPAVHTPFS